MKKNILFFSLIFILIQPSFSLVKFMNVEGLRVRISSIDLSRSSTGDNIATITVNQDVDLNADLSEIFKEELEITLNEQVSSPRFDTITVILEGGVGIKAYTQLDSQNFIYTSSSGPKTLSASSWTEPEDYDFLQNDYLYFPDGNPYPQETTYLVEPVLLNLDSPLTLSLMVDLYNVAYYWDGDDQGRQGFVDTVHQGDPDAFPAGTEVISVTYLPLYIALNKTLEKETYVLANDSSAFTEDDNYELDEVMFMTLTFDADTGEFYQGRTANWDVPDFGWKPSQFILTALIDDEDGSYGFFMANASDGEDPWVDEEGISGFSRLEPGESGTAGHNDDQIGGHTIHIKRVD